MLFGTKREVTVVTDVRAHVVNGVVVNIKKRKRSLIFLDGKLVKLGTQTPWTEELLSAEMEEL